MIRCGKLRGEKFIAEGTVQLLVWIAEADDETSGAAIVFDETDVPDLIQLVELLGAAEPEDDGEDVCQDVTE